MKKINKVFTITMSLLIIILSLSLVGCGSKTQSQSDQTEPVEEYPTRPIEFIVPWGPGGGADQLARLSGKLVEKELNVSLPVINVAGATGVTGMAKLQAAGADGYSISVYIADTHALLTTGKTSWTAEELTPVAMMLKTPSYMFVNADSPFKTWADFEKAAKENPGKYKVATLGEGSIDDVTLRFLESKGIKLTGVPYPNPGERYTSILGGHVDLLFEQAGDVRQYLDGNQIRPLIVFNEDRWTSFPDVPCSKELGYEIYLPQFRSIIAKAGTDPDRIKVLADAFKKVAESPEYVEFLEEQLAVKDSYMGPEEAKAFMINQVDTMNKILSETK